MCKQNAKWILSVLFELNLYIRFSVSRIMVKIHEKFDTKCYCKKGGTFNC